MLRTLLLAVALIVANASGAAWAKTDAADHRETSAKSELAIQILALFDMDQMMAGMEQQMAGVLRAQFDGVAQCEAAKPTVDAASAEMSRLFTEQFTSESYLPEVAQLYVDVFTLEELQAMLDFYRSPLGEKILARTPELMQQSMQIVERQMAAIAPRLEEATDRLGRELAEARKLCQQSSSDD